MIGISQEPPRAPVEIERLVRVISAHEGGHDVMLSRFGVQSTVALEMDGSGAITGGVTMPEDGQLSRAEMGSVGWAGIVAEYLLGYVLEIRSQIPPLTAGAVDTWHTCVWAYGWDFMSAEDRRLISLGGDSLTAARLAFRVLSSPVGSTRLYRAFKRNTSSFRVSHRATQEKIGVAQSEDVYRAAEALIDGRRPVCV